MGNILRFEWTLAVAASSTGKVSSEAAQQAMHAVETYDLDEEDVARRSIEGANPVIPLVADLKAGVDDTSAVHYKATSQDALDTAIMLALEAATADLVATATQVLDKLVGIALEHAATPIMARTLGQQALPTTFGLIAAGWYESVAIALQTLRGLEFPVQYAGPVGTIPGGTDTRAALAEELGLATQPLVWHTNRLPLISIAQAYASLAGALGKVAGDIVLHSMTELAEVSESSPGGSSSMPHKANPAAAIAARGHAAQAPGLLATMMSALDCQAQRGVGSWHSEWQPIRELAATTTSTALLLHRSLDGLNIHAENMQRNVPADWDPTAAAALARQILERTF